MKSAHCSEGSVRETLAIALPIVLSQACETAMVFIGRMFLSKLNPELMNAAMGGGLAVFMMTSFFLGLTGYSTALVAQYLGAKRKQNCSLVVTQALLVCVLAYPVILASRPLAHQLFEVMGLAPAQLEPQKVYFDILLLGAFLPLFKSCLSSFFSGIGRTAVVMVSSCVAMLVSALADYVLIFGHFGAPALGIRGAAYSALIGSASALAILAFAYLRKQNRDEFGLSHSFRIDLSTIKKLLRYGSPTGLEMLSGFMAFNAMVLIFHSRGLVTATAATIMLNWDMVSFVPLMGFEIAITSMVGRYMGARTPDLAHRSVISGMKLGQVYSMVILVLFLAFPYTLVDWFRPSGSSEVYQQAIPTAVTMLRLAAIYVLINAGFVVFVGALRGAGDTFWAMSMGIAVHWVMVLALVLALRSWNLSAEVGWGILVAIFVLFFGLVYLRYRGGKWKAIRLVEAEPPGALERERGECGV
ncbi:MAG TPA: MATE family efflux transporter [Clostridia bacterium]|nr:MATE family efflux transporter [Clostridia bacterium]